jgi:molybdate transport system regulatory protein
MTLPAVTASITLRKDRLGGHVGAERIALLRAIDELGSIVSAAKALGMSYKGAWNAVQALNNLYPSALVVARAGGHKGGLAEVTLAGKALIQAFDVAQSELALALEKLEKRLADPAAAPPLSLIWSLSMKTSARNALRGVVECVELGAVNAEVALKIADGFTITAVVTRHAAEDLGLAPGREAIALVKASFVILASGEGDFRTSARNRLKGLVIRREDGHVNSEVTLELAAGKTLTATITRESADALDLEVGRAATALVKASHVILAVD